MIALSPVPVSESVLNVKEFILLRDDHYVLCTRIPTKKEKLAERIRKLINETDDEKNKRNEKKKARADVAQNKERKLVEIAKNSKISVFDLESFGESQSVALVGFTVNDKYYSHYGEDCIKKFVAGIDCEYLIGYNCNKYDYILVKNEFIHQGWSIKEMRRSTNTLLKAIFTKDGKTIKIVDLLNFTLGTLKKNLESYACTISKGEFDYDKISWNMTDEDRIKLDEYCEKDVLGTLELYKKLDEPFNKYAMTILELFTLSQGAYQILKRKWKAAGILQDQIPRRIDEFIRNSIYGGRCEVFKREFRSKQYDDIKNGRISYDELTDFMRPLDSNSLYPSAMKKNKYPIGVPIFTNSFKNDKMGIYKCAVEKPKDLNIPALCHEGRYDLVDGIATYTSVDIQKGLDYGYKFTCICGYYWNESAYVFGDYIDEFYAIKQNSPSTSSIYKNAKLMLNSPYGKCLQRDKAECHYVIQNSKELVAVYKKHPMGKFTMDEFDTDNEVMRITVEDEIGAYTDKKSWVGAFILSYSKWDMYDLLVKSDPYYTDTDSIYTHNDNCHHFDIGSELGQFSDDIEGRIIYACFPAKKMKYIEYITPAGEFKTEITGKGCYVKGLTKDDFVQMMDGNKIANSAPFKIKRDLQLGTLKVVKDLKFVSMNDGQRVFIGNNSEPYK
jgi:glutaredoxin-related protein